jgi:hypothetical protein
MVCRLLQLLIVYQAVSHESIKSAVPDLIGLLNNRDWSVRTAGAKALSSLAKHCVYKFNDNLHVMIADDFLVANSSDFIASTISSQIKLLEQSDGDQVAGAEALSALAGHGVFA